MKTEKLGQISTSIEKTLWGRKRRVYVQEERGMEGEEERGMEGEEERGMEGEGPFGPVLYML